MTQSVRATACTLGIKTESSPPRSGAVHLRLLQDRREQLHHGSSKESTCKPCEHTSMRSWFSRRQLADRGTIS